MLQVPDDRRNNFQSAKKSIDVHIVTKLQNLVPNEENLFWQPLRLVAQVMTKMIGVPDLLIPTSGRAYPPET